MNDSPPITIPPPQPEWRANFAMSPPMADLEMAEPRLRVSEELYRNLIEGTDNLVTQVDVEGRFTFVNHASRTIFGIEPEQCVGLLAFDFIHPEDRQRTLEWFGQCIQEKKTSASIENRQVSRSGSVRHMIWTTNLRFDPSGELIEINSIARDVTQAKQVEETLQEWSGFVTSNPAPIIRTDCRGKILSWNPAAEALFGHSLKDKSVIDLIPNLSQSAIELMEDSPLSVERTIARKVYRFTIRRARGTGSIYFYGSNVTQRRVVERQLNIERLALQESNAALRAVMARIEDEKREIRESIATNVEKVLTPILRALEDDATPHQTTYITLLKKHLDELTSPFTNRLSKEYASLTPTEVEVCEMIRDGLSSKEIARTRHVSPATVAKQRERIRRKLGLAGTNTNLATHLSLFAKADG